MFDKLIESNSKAANFKDRRRYFMISSVLVGILFLTAVILSIYAGDIGLGSDEFELTTLIAPVDMPEVQPEPPKKQQAAPSQADTSDKVSRRDNMLRPEESWLIPDKISVMPNTQKVRPLRNFMLDPGAETDGPPAGSGREPGGTFNDETDLSNPQASTETTVPEPPPVKPPAPLRPKTLGVVNGIATYLPKPPYPPSAIAVGASGNVNVQVTIDESGKVISSKAVSGHPMLQAAAERAAWNARFTPTYLSNVPVKVTGVIVYKFSRN